MLSFLLWYILVTLLGWIAFPLAYRLLPGLPDRGYSLSRALGLLVWGFLFWLLGSFGLVSNDIGGQLVVLGLVLVGSAWFLVKNWDQVWKWVRKHGKVILWTEIVFLAAFGIWTIVRATNPDIVGTEKPMELAFINSILRSPGFPPNDPWLSGYAISYYYFGYVLVVMLIRMSGVASGVGFNLAVALWFGLTAVSAYGILHNLLTKRWHGLNLGERAWALLAPMFVLVFSNLEGVFEFFHARGIGWSRGADGVLQSPFWTWLNLQELNKAPAEPFSWIPNRPTGILWWRASRVLSDYDLNGGWREVIDEFPFFSYLLADLHPHVLGMPFVLLAIGLALNFYYQAEEHPLFTPSWHRWITSLDFWCAGIILGSLGFFNTWDFPIYVGLLAAVQVLIRYRTLGWGWQRLKEFIILSFFLVIAGILIYLPFYLGFSSQAGGLVPSLSFFTRGVHFWIMFGGLLIPIFIWAVREWREPLKGGGWKAGVAFGSLVVGGLWLLSFGVGAILIYGQKFSLSANGSGFLSAISVKWAEAANGLIGLQGNPQVNLLIPGAMANRLASPGTWLTLLALLVLVWGSLAYRGKMQSSNSSNAVSEVDSGKGFVLLLVLLGAGLALVPEFFYLRDQFGWRMNTIFKFYFQTWILWGMAAAFASAVLIQESRRGKAIIWGVMCLVMVGMLAYPVIALRDKTNDFKPPRFTLDGTAYTQDYWADDASAIQWLAQAPLGVVAEAVSKDGGSYSTYGRVATFSGQPIVLGWIFHESQWRGGTKEVGSRKEDMQTLYQTGDWQQALPIIQQYQIRYIYVGGQERIEYAVDESKFQQHLAVVFQNQGVTIYYVNDSLLVNQSGIGIIP